MGDTWHLPDTVGTMTLAELDILLVEDDDVDAAVAQRLTSLLPGRGSTPLRRATTLAEAIEQISERPPAVILTDLALPGSERMETVTKILDAAPDAAVIVLSGLDDETIAARALSMGVQAYLVKGEYTRSSLARTLHHALSRHRLLVRLRRAEAQISDGRVIPQEISGVLAHDLRAPLRSARLFADVLLNEVPDASPTLIESKRHLDGALDRLQHLITAIVEFETVRSRKPKLDSIGLADVVQISVEAVWADLEAAGPGTPCGSTPTSGCWPTPSS